MHTLVEVPMGTNGGTHVPAFLAKLWKIVDDPATNDLICWSGGGNSFTIKNQAKFARDLLPLYYKHNNMASFVRQLNMYGFHKVVSVEQGGLRVEKDEMEFAHPFFLKGQEASLELIKRKIPASKHEESRVRPDSLNKVLIDVRQMKGRQENLDTKLVTMKRENEALWRELASLRQKHAKQTQIVSKLLQFLVGMMSQQTPRLAFKRRMPLMLNDKDGMKQKLSRTNPNVSCGPVIHDVTELLESDEPEEVSNPMGVMQRDDFLNMHAKSPFGENIGGRMSPDASENLYSVNPQSLNPAISLASNNVGHFNNVQAMQKQQRKVNVPQRRSPAGAPSIATIKNEAVGSAFPNIQNAVSPKTTQQQLMQAPNVPTSTLAQPQNNVPTTLYITNPGMTQPMQVVLSLPEQAITSVANSSPGPNVTGSVGISGTSGLSAGRTVSIPQESPLQKAALANGLEQLGRIQADNQRILKQNGNIVHGDLDGHLDEVEVELNTLKDLFKTDEYNVDGDTLIGVRRPFSLAAIDPETYAQLFNGESQTDNTENHMALNEQLQMSTGHEDSLQGQGVVSYNPSLFELAEEDSNFFDDSSNMFLDDELESMLTTDRDSLNVKRAEGHTRGVVGPLSFAGVNLNNSEGGLHTPMVYSPLTGEFTSIPGTSAGVIKHKRK